MLLIHNDSSVTKEDSVKTDLQKWGLLFRQEYFSGLKSEILWKLPLLYILFGVLLAFVISGNDNAGNINKYLLLTGLLVMLLLQFSLVRVKTSDGLFDILYLLCGLTAIMPAGFLLGGSYVHYNLLIVFLMQAICWMIFPWSLKRSICWSVFLFIYWTIIINYSEINLFYSLTLLVILALAVCLPRLRFQEFNLYHSGLFLSRLCSGTQNSLSLCLQLCKLILFSLDLDNGVLLTNEGKIFRLSNEECKQLKYLNLTAQSLFIQLRDKQLSKGYFRVSNEELAVKGFLYDCLESAAVNLRYYFIKNINQSHESLSLLLVPNKSILDRIIIPRLQSGIQSLLDIFSLSLFATKNQAMSNETVLAYGTALADRDDDINHLVHIVNNKAQEITVNSDTIKQNLSREMPWAERLLIIKDEVVLIEDNIKLLTQSVSDLKLIREIESLRTVPKKTEISLKNIITEFKFYCERAALSKGSKLEFSISDDFDEAGVLIPSPDYLETILRTVLRISLSRVSKTGVVSISIQKDSEYAVFDFMDDGSHEHSTLNVKAIEMFISFSDGIYESSRASFPYKNKIRLMLPACVLKSKKHSGTASWILLVDDSQQVIVFYSRIAEALGLQYETANSYEQAISVLETRGRPRMVITDIQLSNGSGLDLVVYLREHFDSGMPVIVVSGNDDLDVSSKAFEAGATKYLKKPMGRRKLFSEIEELL